MNDGTKYFSSNLARTEFGETGYMGLYHTLVKQDHDSGKYRQWVVLRAKYENLQRLIDPIMEVDMEIGGLIDFWVYQTEDILKYVEHGESIYGTPAHKSIKDGIEMTEEIFTELWESIRCTSTDCVLPITINNQAYWGYS